MDFDLIQAVIYIGVSVLGSAFGGGGVFVYVRRDLDLRFKEREAAIEDQKSENKTFESVVEAFRLSIENQAEVAKERNRIQSETQKDFRDFTKEMMGTLADFRNSMVTVNSSVAGVGEKVTREHADQNQVLSDLLLLQKDTNSNVNKLVQTAIDLKTTVIEQIGKGSIEREKIMQLLDKLVLQANDVGQEPSEKRDDPGVAEGSQKASS